MVIMELEEKALECLSFLHRTDKAIIKLYEAIESFSDEDYTINRDLLHDSYIGETTFLQESEDGKCLVYPFSNDFACQIDTSLFDICINEVSAEVVKHGDHGIKFGGLLLNRLQSSYLAYLVMAYLSVSTQENETVYPKAIELLKK